MGPIFSRANSRTRRREMEARWYGFAIFMFSAIIFYLLVWLIALIFLWWATWTTSAIDNAAMIPMLLPLPIVLNIVIMFLNFPDNPTLTRVILAFDVVATILFAIATLVLVIVSLLNGITGTGAFQTYGIINIVILFLVIIVAVLSVFVMIFHWLSAPQYEKYTDLKPWFRSKHLAHQYQPVSDVESPEMQVEGGRLVVGSRYTPSIRSTTAGAMTRRQ